MRVLLILAVLLAQLPAVARADGGSPWLAGPQAVGDDTFLGFVDAPLGGAVLTPNQQVEVRGWLVDRTASGWSGIDGVQVYLGMRDQGGTLLAAGNVAIPRDDVAAALGNPSWRSSGFSVLFAATGLSVGSNVLTVYAHTPDRGWWYRQVSVQVPAAPDRGFADDPLLVLRDRDLVRERSQRPEVPS